tara:strand:+ start:1250 stop:1729 length:480 start_codon:yes stop_codon:yes gene_type:complete
MRNIIILGLMIFIASCSQATFKSESESQAEEYLLSHMTDYEHLFELAEKKGYIRIQWIDSAVESVPTLRLASIPGKPKHIDVENPELDEMIAYSRSRGISTLWIQKFEGSWIVRKAFSDTNGEGMFLFGNPEQTGICDTHPTKSGCYYEVAENWYLVKG